MNPTVHLQIEVESGERQELSVACDHRSLAEVLAAHGRHLNTRCGQRGLCRGCEVLLCAGGLSTTDGPLTAPATVRACRARLAGDAQIHIPSSSRLEQRAQVGDTFQIAVPYGHQPLFPFVPGARDIAFAVDVGTTTVVVLLVNLATGAVLYRAGAFNEQIRFGDNVVTRIETAQKPGNLLALQRAVVTETILPLLKRACQQAGLPLERIAGGAIAGNTTMLHLLVGEDPTPLGIAPFTPRFLHQKQVLAGEINLIADGLAPATLVQLLPGIGAYIGADITAGIFASGMVFDTSPSLLVDIGTNGEIVLQSAGQLMACATAAGPAFEGCGLSCGTRALEGAVSQLRLSFDPFLIVTEMIGKVPLACASGLCGSAYVDFLATARSGGLLSATGRFNSAAWAALPQKHRLAQNGERSFCLTEATGVRALGISEVDIALLLQAKAAIGAGIETLLNAAHIDASALGQVYLAGGFGMHLDVAHAIAIGLLPGVRHDQVRVVGNTALAGALLVLVDRTILDEMADLRPQVEVIELNLAPGFEESYIDHLLLP